MIEQAFRMKGGWEGWLQVELGLQLEATGQAIVEREQHVYKNNLQKTDMVITSLGSQPPIRTIVEFKCESLAQDCVLDAQGQPVATNAKGKPHFAGRIEDDLAKVGKFGKNLLDEYDNCWYLCIGFSFSPQAREYLSRAGDFTPVTARELVKKANIMGFFRSGGQSQSDQDDTLVMWFSLGRKESLLTRAG